MSGVAETSALVKAYRAGTHRLVSSEETIARVRPHLPALEVTRLADVTGLDRIGLPVYCAIRPRGLILQSTNGKGARVPDAQASALMEAVEHHHAERPLPDVRRTSARVLTREGARVIPPHAFAQYRAQTYWSDDFIVDWAPAVDLLGGDRVWVPASAVYSGVTPCLHDFTANGLASGNHLVEATLHAIYEVVERDTVSRLNVNGRIALTPPACRAVDLSTLDGVVRDLFVRLDGAGITPVLLAVASPSPFHTFWAALIDPAPFSAASTVNVGYGTHLSPTVAAVRALTEAAQSRVCYIHGAREDLAIKMREQTNQVLQRIAATFLRLQPSAAWPDFEDFSTSTLSDDATKVFRSLAESGIAAVYRVDLSRKPYNVPVVKILIPGMLINRRFF